jgi:hypothetical protein
MQDLDVRVNELGLQGRCCTQLLVQIALEERGDENSQMVEAVGALCLGLFEGLGCGALSGGALAMALLAEGHVDGTLISELVDWFRREYETTECEAILAGDPAARFTRCPSIVAATYAEARAILQIHGLLRD